MWVWSPPDPPEGNPPAEYDPNARRSPKDPSDTEVILSFTSLILLIIYEATKAQANQFIDEIKDICLKNQILEKVVSKMHDLIISRTLFRTRTTKTKPIFGKAQADSVDQGWAV